MKEQYKLNNLDLLKDQTLLHAKKEKFAFKENAHKK